MPYSKGHINIPYFLLNSSIPPQLWENHITKANYYNQRVQGLINLTLESYTFNVELQSHTLQLGPN